MSQKLLGTQDSIDILPTVRKIDNNSTPLGFNITSPKLGNTLSEEIITKVIDIVDYGFPDGDIILLTTMKPRSDSHYLRVSPFKGVAKKDAAGEFLQKFIRFNGEKIIIAPGGGVHYDVTDNIVIGCRNYSPMIITGVLDDCSVSLKFITAYLKSSIAIWYAERCLGSSDLREPSSLNLPIPDNVPIEFCAKVEKLLDTILSLESDFLKQQIGLSSMHSSDEEEANCLIKKSDDLTIMHNNTANRYMGQIDDLFYDFYGLSNKEICSVEQQLMLSGFATFPRNSPE
jgi:hypothetical protein